MAARFFCDNCGTEVKRNSNRCPQCGRSFIFVRCPKCSYRGEEKNFENGCPVCGYCTPGNGKTEPGAPKYSLMAAGKLPLWVYVIAFLGLVFVALVLYITIR